MGWPSLVCPLRPTARATRCRASRGEKEKAHFGSPERKGQEKEKNCSPQNFLPGPLLEPAFKQAAPSGGHHHESARCEHGVSPGHRHGKAPAHRALGPSTKRPCQHPKHHRGSCPVPPARKAQLQPEQRGTSQVWPGGLILSHEEHPELAQRQKTILMMMSENTTPRFCEKHHRCTKRKLLRKKPAQARRKRGLFAPLGHKEGLQKGSAQLQPLAPPQSCCCWARGECEQPQHGAGTAPTATGSWAGGRAAPAVRGDKSPSALPESGEFCPKL